VTWDLGGVETVRVAWPTISWSPGGSGARQQVDQIRMDPGMTVFVGEAGPSLELWQA
jgi:hypothetical protein